MAQSSMLISQLSPGEAQRTLTLVAVVLITDASASVLTRRGPAVVNLDVTVEPLVTRGALTLVAHRSMVSGQALGTVLARVV